MPMIRRATNSHRKLRRCARGRLRNSATSQPESIPWKRMNSLHCAQTGSEHSLGDLPLVVLTRGLSEDEGPNSKAFEEEHRRDLTALAAMSGKGRLVIAAHSGHH